LAVFISKEPYKIISKEPYKHLHPKHLKPKPSAVYRLYLHHLKRGKSGLPLWLFSFQKNPTKLFQKSPTNTSTLNTLNLNHRQYTQHKTKTKKSGLPYLQHFKKGVLALMTRTTASFQKGV